MSLYLPVRSKGGVAIAICFRCQKKVHYATLKQDPNNLNYYCGDCVDIYDPWRLPARQAENITLDHPRPDISLTVSPPPAGASVFLITTENLFNLSTENSEVLAAESV